MGELWSKVNTIQHNLSCVYDEHASSLFRFILSLTRCAISTEDIIQELFCRLAANPTRLDKVSNLRSYLFRSAHRIVIDSAKKRSRLDAREAVAHHTSPFAGTDDPDAKIFHRSVHDALTNLPTEQRSVVYLKVWEEFTFQEIAGALDISPNTAASRYRYGIAKLREALQFIYDEIQ